MSIFSRTFAKAAAERAVKAAAWTAGATIGTGATGLLGTDWRGVASAAGMAAILSILGSIGSDAATGNGPSLTNAETLADTTTVTVASPADAPAEIHVEARPADELEMD